MPASVDQPLYYFFTIRPISSKACLHQTQFFTYPVIKKNPKQADFWPFRVCFLRIPRKYHPMVRRERMETDILTSVKRSCDDDFNIKQKQVSKQRMFPEHQVVTQWFRSGCSNAAGLQTHSAKNDKTHRAGDARDVFSEMIEQIDGNQQKYQPT